MKDFIPKGNGDSRYLKSSISADMTWEEAKALFRAGTFPVDFNGVNADGVQQMGTANNKANMLQDSTAAVLGLDSMDDPTVNDAFLAASGKYILKLQVTVDGKPAKAGVAIASGMTAFGGMSLETDENGVVTGIISPSGATVTSRNYVDLPAKSITIPAPSSPVVEATLALDAPSAGEKDYTTSTSGIYFSPYIDTIDICCVGGGGGGGGAIGPNACAGGGGGGYTQNALSVSVDFNVMYSITVGAGGLGGTGEQSGSTGGTSSFSSLLSAIGGSGGGPGYAGNGAGGDGDGKGGIGGIPGENYFGGNGTAGSGKKFGEGDVVHGGGGGGAQMATTYGAPRYGLGGAPNTTAYGGHQSKQGDAFPLHYDGYDASVPGGGGGGACSTSMSAPKTGGKGYRGQVSTRWRVAA